jgi:hypothetical protein
MSKNKSHGNDLEGRDPESGRFISGNNGGGRKVGSRNRLGEQFVADLLVEWKRSGPECLRRLASENPAAFVRAVGNVLPAQLKAELNVNVSLFKEIENTNEAYRVALAYLHRKIEAENEPALIEATNGAG